jgi:hypothetical protein
MPMKKIQHCKGQTGNQILVGVRFSTPVQTAPGPTQPPIQWVPGLLPRGKAVRTWCGSPTPHLMLKLKKEYTYIYSPSQPSCTILE